MPLQNSQHPKPLGERRKICFTTALILCGLWSSQSTLAEAQISSAKTQLDADGVHMLFPSKPGGSALALGASNPNTSKQFGFDFKAVAKPGQLSSRAFWTIEATPLNYSSGNTGYTARLHLYASGGTQRFNWKTQTGYISNPADINNQEFTVYVRVRESAITSASPMVTLKIRGGGHHPKDPDAASCTMMTFGPGDRNFGVTRFGKELSHPDYDYVALTPKIDARLIENTWIGLKLISYTPAANALDGAKKKQVINQLYVDTAGFNAQGEPANQWQLLSEYIDEAGKSTGRYNTLVNWGGWQTTLRMDGFRHLDFSAVSVREIVAP